MDDQFKRYAISRLNEFLFSSNADISKYPEFKSYLSRKIENLLETNKFKITCLDKISDIDIKLSANPIDRLKDNQEVKIFFRQHQCPGDILTLTASIRDIKKAYPNALLSVKTTASDIWENNPYITKFTEKEADIVLDLEYPLIHQSNNCGRHFIFGFKEFIEKELEITFELSKFSCDLHLSKEEISWMNQVQESIGYTGKYWIINCGSKSDFPLKQWDINRWQEVIDKLKHKITFVQVGAKEHKHKPLDGVIDLVGKTDLRQLFRLCYHSEGALTHVSMLLHTMSVWGKPCVCIAGGRESSHWESYNDTIYLDTIGQLSCCLHGGCWKSKERECLDMIDDQPRCMKLITVDDVVRSIERYYDGGRLEYEKEPYNERMGK